MTDPNQTNSVNQPHHKNRPKVKGAIVAAEQSGQQLGLVPLPAEPIGSEVADGRAIPEVLLRGPQGVFGGGSITRAK